MLCLQKCRLPDDFRATTTSTRSGRQVICSTHILHFKVGEMSILANSKCASRTIQADDIYPTHQSVDFLAPPRDSSTHANLMQQCDQPANNQAENSDRLRTLSPDFYVVPRPSSSEDFSSPFASLCLLLDARFRSRSRVLTALSETQRRVSLSYLLPF
jgi:hypothetical protein